MKKKNFTAFTLAEVLITLSIIGVVAALTIPTLIQRTGDEEIVSKLSKTYSTLSQAAEMIITERGGVKTWAENTDSVYSIFKEHLRNAKECGSTEGCFKQKYYKYLKGENSYSSNYDTRAMGNLILSDGVQIAFHQVSPSCSYGRNDWDIGSDNVCAIIHADLNGVKAPNALGRDLFTFVLKETGLYPAGCDTDYCSRDYTGYGCACKVLQEGKIDY